MSDIITLSSDEEDSPPKKKVKPTILIGLKGITITPIPKNNNSNKKVSKDKVVVLSDDEDLNSSLSRIGKEMPDLTFKKIRKSPKNSFNNCVVIDDNDCEIEKVENKKDKEKDNSQTCYVIDDPEDKLDLDKQNDEDDCEIVEEAAKTDKKYSRNCRDKENISENISKSRNKFTKEDFTVLQESSESDKDDSKDNCTSGSADDISSQPSTSKPKSEVKPPQTVLLESFIDICEKNVKDSQYTIILEKIPVLLKFYRKCECSLGDCTNFKQLLLENIEKAKHSAARSVICFKEVFQYIKDVVNTESIEVSEKVRIKLKKFDKTIKLLTQHIRHLENSEVNFDDDEDSAYIQLDRYTTRLNKVYEKYCQLLKRHPHYGRITYAKLDFVASDYNEINRAICKKYKNNKKFPSYFEMETFIRKIAKEQNLQITETEIKVESSRCFKKLGELLQHRRKRELYDTHYDFIRDSTDPATDDLSLNSQLKDNYLQGQKNIDKLCEEYVVKQEIGEEVVISEEDSDKSDYVDSEDDDKNNSDKDTVKKKQNGNDDEEKAKKKEEEEKSEMSIEEVEIVESKEEVKETVEEKDEEEEKVEEKMEEEEKVEEKKDEEEKVEKKKDEEKKVEKEKDKQDKVEEKEKVEEKKEVERIEEKGKEKVNKQVEEEKVKENKEDQQNEITVETEKKGKEPHEEVEHIQEDT